jgi:hypothetical protein
MLVYQRVYQLFYVIVNSMTLLIIIEFITIIISIVIIVITSITMIIIVIIYISIKYPWTYYIIIFDGYISLRSIIVTQFPTETTLPNWIQLEFLPVLKASRLGLRKRLLHVCILYIYMYQKWIMMG